VLVLVHSPVTGPSTWRWVADSLRARGHQVIVPAVAPPITSAAAFADAVADAIAAQLAGLARPLSLPQGGDRPVLVGHSGAGPVLPLIAARLPAARLVFVDADVPPDAGDAELMPAQYLEPLRSLAVNGMLPRWSEWFGPDTMRELIPDDARRAIVCAELPELPLSYFEARVPVPPGWAGGGGGYVLLSEAYEEAAAAAAARGWPVERRMGAHLDLVTRPDQIARAILLVARSSAST
jgi:Alpha/beta hydrolase family